MFALVAAVFAVGLAARATAEARSATEALARRPAPAATAAVTVGLDEFSIEPGDLSVPAGSVLAVRNDGTTAHDLAVEGLSTPLLDPEGSAELDLGELAAGSYTMICEVAGHEASGMRGTLTIE